MDRLQYIKPKPNGFIRRYLNTRPDSYVVTAGGTINGPMQDFLDFPLFYLGPLDLGFWTDDLVKLKRRGL